ncbi:MAG: hypothetical protein ABI573_03540, partial [Chloroflexota bacterium]
MTTRRNPPATPESDPETAQLGTLIQSVADDWHMPPQQLGEITWRDRTSAGRAWRPRRRTGDRLIAPIAAALVASVGLAFVAVWLQQDVGIVGSSPTPGHSNRPTAAGPSASPLPNFLLNGELPSVTSVVVNAAGTYRIADLTIGTVGKALFAGPSGPSKVVARPGGGWVCVCSDWTASSANGPTEARITLRPTSADGSALPMVDVRTIAGRADPKDPASGTSQLIDVGVTGSDDGRWAFVGWSARDGAQWTAGIDVVDVASLRVVASTRLPLVKPSVTGSRPVVRAAPVASLSPDGSAIVVASFWYMDDSTASHPPQATDHWIASFNGSTIGPLSVAGTTPDTVTWEYSVGMIDASRYYALRSYASGGFTFDRLQPDGTIIGQSDVSAIGGGVDGGTLMTRIANALFIWNPQATTLVRVDLASGTVSSSKASAAA